MPTAYLSAKMMDAMKTELVPLDGGRPIPIDRDLVLVGRRAGCEVRIDDKTVSKLHCVLARTDGLMLIRDLGSTNGCKVNGRKVRRALLLPNDVLSIAKFDFRIHLEGSSAQLRKDAPHAEPSLSGGPAGSALSSGPVAGAQGAAD